MAKVSHITLPNGTVLDIPSGGGASLPVGGTTGQVLAKKSDSDQDVEWSDYATTTVSNGRLIKITTNPSSYTTVTGGFKPSYRVAKTAFTANTTNISNPAIGDLVYYSSYYYYIGYVDNSYVYLSARVSIVGPTGATGPRGPAGATGPQGPQGPAGVGLGVTVLLTPQTISGTSELNSIDLSIDSSGEQFQIYGTNTKAQITAAYQADPNFNLWVAVDVNGTPILLKEYSQSGSVKYYRQSIIVYYFDSTTDTQYQESVELKFHIDASTGTLTNDGTANYCDRNIPIAVFTISGGGGGGGNYTRVIGELQSMGGGNIGGIIATPGLGLTVDPSADRLPLSTFQVLISNQQGDIATLAPVAYQVEAQNQKFPTLEDYFSNGYPYTGDTGFVHLFFQTAPNFLIKASFEFEVSSTDEITFTGNNAGYQQVYSIV